MATTETITPLPQNNNTFVTDTITFLREEDAARYNRQFAGFVVSGGTATSAGGLSHTIAALEAFVHGYYVAQPDTLMTYTASRRTFCYVDSLEERVPEVTFSGGTGATFKLRDGNLVFVECANGSAQPTPSVPGLVAVLYADTDGSSITSAIDLRLLSPIVSSTKTIDPAEYGILGDGLTDNFVAINAMLAALPVGSIVQFGPGTFNVSNTITVPKGCIIRGVGSSSTSTIIRTTNATTNVFTVTSVDQVAFRDLQIDSSVTRTAGYGIQFTGNARLNRVDDLTINNMYYGIGIFHGIGWTVSRCNILESRSSGVVVSQNILAPDSEGSINNCVISSTNITGTFAIIVNSSIGLDISNNRITGHEYGILIDPTVTSGTISIVNNRIRNVASIAIGFIRTAGSAIVSEIEILDNIIVLTGTYGIYVGTGVANVFINGIIASNLIVMSPNTSVGIRLDGDTQFLVEGNNIYLGTGGSSVCIQLTQFSTSVNIGHNGYRGDVFVQNNSAITPTAVPLSIPIGVVSIDPPSIAGGALAEVTAAVSIASVGDVLVLNRPNTTDLPGSIDVVGCRVSGPGQISVFLRNITGSPVNPDPANWSGALLRALI